MLNKINERFYSYLDRNTGMLFTLKYGDRGIYGAGKAWYLKLTYGSEKQTLATFSVKDDGHRTYQEDYLGRLWKTEDVLREANEMVSRVLS